MKLTSTRNPRIQKVRRAAADGRPTDDGLIVAEGPHLLDEAIRGHWVIEQILVSGRARDRYRDLLHKADAEIVEISERALAAAATTDTPQPLVTLLRPRRWEWEQLTKPVALLVALDRIQDPGNLGTIVRSAEAFGATGVVFLKGCAKIANGKVLRAAAGSLFRIPYLDEVSERDLVCSIRANGLTLYALSAQAKRSIRDADFSRPCALLVGSEGQGISKELLTRAEGLSIPTAAVESLNAGVACSIGLYEARQQRRQT